MLNVIYIINFCLYVNFSKLQYYNICSLYIYLFLYLSNVREFPINKNYLQICYNNGKYVISALNNLTPAFRPAIGCLRVSLIIVDQSVWSKNALINYFYLAHKTLIDNSSHYSELTLLCGTVIKIVMII